jgi:hypothetical protein
MPTQITHMPEPVLPTEDPYPPYPGSSKSNGVGLPIYRNDSSTSYVLPPLPHQAYPPGKLANPHTDSPSCESVSFSEKASFELGLNDSQILKI